MPDDTRAANVQRFREEQGAQRVHVLTVHAPFSVRQDRFIVLEEAGGARFVCATGCTPRTAFDKGEQRAVEAATLNAFRQAQDAAADAWRGDAVPPTMHDGVTITVEWADADDYRRVRIVDPQAGSVHARLLAAWSAAFPEVKRALR